MKFLLLFEDFDIQSHLKMRGIDTSKTRVIIDEETEDVYFFLYNLSGKMVGFQKYNRNYEKTGQSNLGDPRMAKYFTWVSDEGYGKQIGVWGLESYSFEDKFIFICEGIFDAARIHEAGYPAIAVLCNNPSDSLKSWLMTLPQKKIVIYDNDKAGKKLIKVGDFSYTVPRDKDINDLTPEEAKMFLEDCLIKSKNEFILSREDALANIKKFSGFVNELFDRESSFKSNVYGKEESHRSISKNSVIIWNNEYSISFEFIFDDKELEGYTFVHLYPYWESSDEENNWKSLSTEMKSKLFIDAIKKLPKVLKRYFRKFGKLKRIVFRPRTSQMGRIYSVLLPKLLLN